MKEIISEKYDLVNKQCFFWQPDKKRMKLLFGECEFYIEFNCKNKTNKHIDNFVGMRMIFNILGFEDNVIILADEVEQYKNFVPFYERVFDKGESPIRFFGAILNVIPTKEIKQLEKEIQSRNVDDIFECFFNKHKENIMYDLIKKGLVKKTYKQ